jgi:hypothetical protein
MNGEACFGSTAREAATEVQKGKRICYPARLEPSSSPRALIPVSSIPSRRSFPSSSSHNLESTSDLYSGEDGPPLLPTFDLVQRNSSLELTERTLSRSTVAQS